MARCRVYDFENDWVPDSVLDSEDCQYARYRCCSNLDNNSGKCSHSSDDPTGLADCYARMSGVFGRNFTGYRTNSNFPRFSRFSPTIAASLVCNRGCRCTSNYHTGPPGMAIGQLFMDMDFSLSSSYRTAGCRACAPIRRTHR